MSEYLTPDIRGLIDHIRTNKDWALMGMLADALEDAGFKDKEMLRQLRESCPRSQHAGWKLLALVEGGVRAESVLYLEELAENIEEDPFSGNTKTYLEFMEEMEAQLRTGQDIEAGFDYPDVILKDPKTVWAHFANVTGLDVSQEEDIVFSCDC